MKNKIVVFIWPLLLVAALIIDTLTPLGFADYFFYSGILFLFIYSNSKYILLAGITSIAFIIIGYYFSPNDFSVPIPIAIFNRILGILLIIFIMYVMLKLSKRGIELTEKVTELEITNNELESFNFISRHDFQEPLRKIQNFVSILLKEKNISESGEFYLQQLGKTSQQMRLLMEDILKYSRINKIDLIFEQVKIVSVLEEVIANYQDTFAEHPVDIKIEGNCDASIIPALFRQVISNLIDNSFKFSHAGRPLKIIIRCEIIYGNKLIPELSSNLNYCHINFVDNGIGFDPQYNERVFEFFERLNGQKYPGTGLGLAICRKIVETHRGIIKANGQLNKGVQFDIYIPYKR